MTKAFFDDELLDAQLQRAMMAGDRDRCLATAGRIGQTLDLEKWYDEWRSAGDAARKEAADALSANDSVTACFRFFDAATFFRTAAVMLMSQPVDPRVVAANHDQTDAFERGSSLLDRPPERVQIPFEDTTLPGYFFDPTPALQRPSAGPTLVLTGGYDGTAEELYHFTGAAALEHGYRVLCFDGPGQGAALLQQHLVMRPDWENVIGSVLDWATDRNDVDANRIALVGLSLGAHLAPRAASAQHRLAACVADCGSFDLAAAASARIPKPLRAGLDPNKRMRAWLLGKVLDVLAAKPTAGWALRRGQLVHGADRPIEYLRSLAPFSLKGRAETITCPTFVNNAEDDDIGASAPQLVAELRCPHTFVTFRRNDGAGDHCEVGNRALYLETMFAWLDPILQANPPNVSP